MMRRKIKKIRQSWPNLFHHWLVSAATAISIILTMTTISSLSAHAQSNVQKKGPSGLPLPRFVSLKSDKVNVRKGPSTEHKVTWVYRKAGLPVEILAEFENWRQVRDSDGVEGWVFHALLSGRRTALITPWSKTENNETASPVELYRSKNASQTNIAILVDTGVLANVLECNGGWCRLSIQERKGWIKQDKLWGVYQEEKIK